MDQSTNLPTSWDWDFGDGGTSTEQNPLYTYTAVGTYTVSLKATNASGFNTETKTDYIIVYGTVIDHDGNTYLTVTIGTQTWMAENLRTTHYNDGTEIPNVTNNDEWSNLETGAYCWYDNDETSYKDTYGALYNWYSVETGKLCPTGWHMPTDDEWTTLEDYLIDNGYGYLGSGIYIGQALAATSLWRSSDEASAVGNFLAFNNKSGFSALPGGLRYKYGIFNYIRSRGYWWSSTEYGYGVKYRYLRYDYSSLHTNHEYKEFGFSVRCVRDY